MKTKLHIAGLLIMIFYGLQAEDHFFRHYSTDEGLLNPYIYAMTQDTSGYLWIGTGEGLFRFDGFTFENFEADSGLMNSFISALYTSSAGAVLIGQQDGSLAVWNNGKISSIYVPMDYTGMVTGITEDIDGNCWVSHQGGSTLRVTPDFVVSEIEFHGIEENISGILHIQDDMFLIGSFDGLLISRYSHGDGKMSIVSRIDQFPATKVVEMIKGPGDNTMYIISQDEGIYKARMNSSGGLDRLVVLDDNSDGRLDNLQGAVMDEAGILWIASMGGGILKYEVGDNAELRNTRELNTENGLITNDISQIMLDDEGNLWLGTYGRGILRYVQNQLSFHSWTAKDEHTAAWSLALHKEGLSVFGKGSCSLINPLTGELKKEVKLDGLPESAKITASYMDPQGNMWLGTESSGMYVRQGSAGRFRTFSLSNDELSRSVNHISGDGKNLWVSTKRGLCQVKLSSRKLQWYTTESGLPHNNIMGTCLASGGRVYIATICKEVYFIDRDDNIGILENSSFGSVVSIASVAECDDQSIWLATEGYGVWKITRNESINYSQHDGLVSDYCYSIISSQGKILVTHRGGLSVIDVQRESVKGFDKAEGLSSSLEFFKNAFAVDVDRVWFGTSEGLLSYKFSQKHGTDHAPMLNINTILIDENEIDLTEKMITLPSGFHDLQLEYVGIDFSSPESVRYRSRLTGYSHGWSTWSDSRTVNYFRLSHGSYTFQLEAMSDSGALSSAKDVFQIHIRRPVYMLFWFWALIILGVAALFFLLLKIRERALRAQQANLENQLEIRTSEVLKQKEEIELYNKEIRESINYASKIQQSIMPAHEEFSELLSDYFIFYRPHSIVSGDFYWLSKLDDGRILIVCADSTGHGIPGAFMSMIGITLIKEIVTHNSNINPGELLNKLDQEVHKTLVQKSEEDSLPDGMDLSISFLDPESGKLEVSSAMNSFMIHTSSGPIYQSGTKLSIGGKYFNANKVFENHIYELSAGDKVYFFSDGYVDQFGGPDGKKFMHANFKELISEIYKLPMHEQLMKIEHTFDEWKGSENQVDDVLVLGFEI